MIQSLPWRFCFEKEWGAIPRGANYSQTNESSEVFDIIQPGRRVKLNRSQAVNVHKRLTIRYLQQGQTFANDFLNLKVIYSIDK